MSPMWQSHFLVYRMDFSLTFFLHSMFDLHLLIIFHKIKLSLGLAFPSLFWSIWFSFLLWFLSTGISVHWSLLRECLGIACASSRLEAETLKPTWNPRGTSYRCDPGDFSWKLSISKAQLDVFSFQDGVACSLFTAFVFSISQLNSGTDETFSVVNEFWRVGEQWIWADLSQDWFLALWVSPGSLEAHLTHTLL